MEAPLNAAAHVYGKALDVADPVATQPERIRVDLKAHQKAALAMAMTMEREGCIKYNIPNDWPAGQLFPGPVNGYKFRGAFKAYTNVGILGDLVGHGKTLTALSIIASTPTHHIHEDYERWYSYMAHATQLKNSGHVRIACEPCDEEIATRLQNDQKFSTTLIIVPRGPVFTQWRWAAESQTNLKTLVIDTMKCVKSKMPPTTASNDEMHEFFEQFDCVIIKTTTLKQLFDHYYNRERPIIRGERNPAFYGFDRIIIDEAHNEIAAIPAMSYKFLWLVTSTYHMMCHRSFSSVNYMSNGIRHLMDPEVMDTFVIRGTDEFVRASFELPRMTEYTYICKMSMVIAALHTFLAQNVQERLNVGDIAGAVREMGGKAETEEELVRMLTAGIHRDINNKQRELAYVEGIDMEAHARELSVARLQGELRRLEEKRDSLAERVTALEQKQCAVCMDNYDEPVMLACTHVFCGQCVVDWMRARARNPIVAGVAPGCPTCREIIDTKKMVAVVSEDERRAAAEREAAAVAPNVVDDDLSTNESDAAAAGRFKKEEILIRLLKRKPNGKWLIFTSADNGFVALRVALANAGISFAELKGNTNVMMHTLDSFKRGDLKVILLHTRYAGSGIDISCATDVIIYHSMGMSKIQAIGRAQRVGRTSPLTVHNLMYPNEIAQ